MIEINEIKNILEKSQDIAIFGHQSIDGDAIGSMFGLGLQLEKLGKNVQYFTPDRPSHIFDFLDIDKLQTEFNFGSYDLIIFTDFSTYEMIKKFTRGNEKYFDENKKVIIDHHIFSYELPNSIEFRDDSSISAAQIIFELTQQWWPNLIDSKIATFLLTGIMTDSGNFRYDEGPESIRVSKNNLELLKRGAQKKLIIDNIFRSKSYEDLEFMQIILGRMVKQGNVIYSRYSQSELEEFGLHPDSADYALYLMCDIKNQDLVILGKEKEDCIKFSLRAKGMYNCRDIAIQFGGGGHANAAGCSINKSGNIKNDVQQFVDKIKSFLK